MDMDIINDKLSIKNLLFTKAIPNYVIPAPVNGHTVYSCTDCGDRFIFESSYDHHVLRKSMKISYMCRHCGQMKFFYNRCNLLCHIRSHAFKTATINVTDLKIEPLPLSHFKMTLRNTNDQIPRNQPSETCFECKKIISGSGPLYKNRANHFMQYTNEVHTCCVCLFALPTFCGLQAHMRFHLKCSPYYCPECGVHLPNKNVHYPYNHDCEGFKMMRATARIKCPIPECHLIHPNDFKDHMKHKHLKKVYKCPFCVVACFSDGTMMKHLAGHKTENKALIFYQCELCPGRLVLQNHMDNHLKSHVNTNVFPCWSCGMICQDVISLISHNVKKHVENDVTKRILNSITKEFEQKNKKTKRIYRVVKRCDQCKRSFTYKCKYDEIGVLPNECPYKCSSSIQSNEMTVESEAQITCYMCKSKISQNWEEIKKHFSANHKGYRFLDAKIVLNKIDVSKYALKKKTKHSELTIVKKVSRRTKKKSLNTKSLIPNKKNEIVTATPTSTENKDQYSCNKCMYECKDKSMLEAHMINHRDPCMAYQCMECGQSFVVKPSFSTHLLLEHGISNAEEYINTKQCYNENALEKYNYGIVTNEPLSENQCRICREQFINTEELEKHFRVHGMAFLMKTSNKTNSS